MSWGQIVASATDPYGRKARLYPAILALLPVAGLGVALYGVDREIEQLAVALATTCGGVYLLVNVGREHGKRIETELFKQWGGTPTTQLQRHRDVRIDAITKQARHAFLARKLGIPAPTAAQESANPATADDFYAASTRWLVEHTRDHHRFRLIFDENVAYGYRRNALGLKRVGILACLLSIGWVLASHGVLTLHGADETALAQMTQGAKLSLGLSFTMLIIWIGFFTKQTVKTAAFAYADMLLRACEALR